MTQIKQIVLAKRPKGTPSAETFRVDSAAQSPLNSGEVLLKPLYISVDPYLRGRITDVAAYSPFAINAPIMSGAVAVIEESKSTTLKKGDKVLGMLPWATQAVEKDINLQKIDESVDVPLSYYLGVLGMPGQTAYFGIMDICKPKPGETVVISAAAGAVGIAAGQIAKIQRARVVGIAGSDEKLKMLKNTLHFDEVINYKTSDIASAIAAACPSGVDCYFDNVGGEITDAVISNFNRYARMALCGQISLYNLTEIPVGPRMFPRIQVTSTLVKGFIVGDYQDRFPEATVAMTKWVQEKKLLYKETIMEGFDELPNAFIGLFEGSNTGKMVVKI